MKKPKPKKRRQQYRKQPLDNRLTFGAHIRELRVRIVFIGLALVATTGLAYAFQQELTRWLLAPAGNQQFIYTTPGGGFDFQVRLCLYAGVAAAIPVVVYQFIRYIQPLLKNESKRFVRVMAACSTLLAGIGVTFGYHVGLPAALHFLLQHFSNDRIQALITAQSYLSFVAAYLLGAALLFHIPLILLLINRIKPLRPSSLFRHQQWFVLGAFIIAAILSPTPDIPNQLLLSLPLIAMYEVSIGIIWLVNRRKRPSKRLHLLLETDHTQQIERLESFERAKAQWRTSVRSAHAPPRPQAVSLTTVQRPSPALPRATIPPRPNRRPQQYIQDFQRPQSVISN